MRKQPTTTGGNFELRRTPALSFVLATLAVLAVLAVNHTARASILGTEDQRAKEALALRLLASAPMQQAERQLEELYRKDPRAATPGGQATLHSAAEAWAMVSANSAANTDPDRPVLMWSGQPRHKWFGLDVPRAGGGGDNPDNVYRSAPIDGAARYEIRGKIIRPGPAQETFALDGQPAGNPKNASATMTRGGRALGSAALEVDQNSVAPDGSFTITIDSDPANGRPNHIQSQSDQPHENLLIRDTLADWATQNPVALNIRRVSGPPLHPAPAEADLAARAAEILSTTAPFWLDWEAKNVYTLPVNQLPTPTVRVDGPPGWGMISMGHFALTDDEALVVTIDRLGAASLGVSLSDPWGPTLDYKNRSGSVNQSQARPNSDGTYTYVIATQDPGVYNWVDADGVSSGKILVRWQALPPGAATARGSTAVHTVQVVKLRDLSNILPPGTVFVTAEERKAQLTARAADYNRRLEH